MNSVSKQRSTSSRLCPLRCTLFSTPSCLQPRLCPENPTLCCLPPWLVLYPPHCTSLNLLLSPLNPESSLGSSPNLPSEAGSYAAKSSAGFTVPQGFLKVLKHSSPARYTSNVTPASQASRTYVPVADALGTPASITKLLSSPPKFHVSRWAPDTSPFVPLSAVPARATQPHADR